MKDWSLGNRILLGFIVMLAIPLALGFFARACVQVNPDGFQFY